MDSTIKSAILTAIITLILTFGATYASMRGSDVEIKTTLDSMMTTVNRYDGRITTNRIADEKLNARMTAMEVMVPQILGTLTDIKTDMASTKKSVSNMETNIAVMKALQQQEEDFKKERANDPL